MARESPGPRPARSARDGTVMNSLERVLAAVGFRTPDRTPVIPQVFGHAATLAGVALDDYLRHGALLARCQTEAWRRYGYDAVFAFTDACIESEAAGSSIAFFADRYPVVASFALPPDWDGTALAVPDPQRAGRMPELLEAVRLLREGVGAEVPVVGLVLGPMTLAGQLMGLEAALYLAIDRPQLFQQLLDYATRLALRFGEAQLAAGAHLLIVFEPSGCGEVVPPMFFLELLLPRIRTLFDAFKRAGSVANWLHIAGWIEPLLSWFPQTGADVVNVDHGLDPARARSLLPRTCLAGNLKPYGFVSESPEVIAAESRRLLQLFAPRGGFILSSGCELPLEARPDNIAAMVAAARSDGESGGPSRP